MKPSIKLIKSWGLLGKSVPTWGGFKHKLVEHGIINNVDCDAPEEWKRVYCRACNRPYPMR